MTILLVGCSSGSGGSATSPASRPATSTVRRPASTAAFQQWASCMREHGVSMPTRPAARGTTATTQPLGQRPTRASVREAFEKCRNLIPGARKELGKTDRTKLRDAAIAYAQCMRIHGFEMPDPAPPLHGEQSIGGGAAAFRALFGNGNTNDPAFQQADKVCRPALRKALGMEDAHS
ncbi:MAG TPA: hypothetical protein VIC35_12055 [Acidimicrobiia bacterium]|jgi:hypothetical protein